MRICLFTFILFHTFFANSQSSKKIASLISELNNAQFIIDHSAKASFSYQSKAADKLMKIGSKAKKQLITALEDSSKTVMAQLVLSHIRFKQVSFAGPKITSEGDYNINNYFLGEEKGEGLIVSERKVNGTYIVYAKKADIEKIKLYWEKRSQ